MPKTKFRETVHADGLPPARSPQPPTPAAREAAEDNAAIDTPPAFVGSVDGLEAHLEATEPAKRRQTGRR